MNILESITEDGPECKALNIFCFKEPEHVMKIMGTWMALEELDREDTRHEYKGRDGQSLVRQFKYWHPFSLHLSYHHQVEDYNNRRHDTILIERTWATKFWPDRNFTWYLDVTEVNTALADGHFCKGDKLVPTLQFHKKLAHEMMDSTIGLNTVNSRRPRRSTYTPDIVPCKLQKVEKHEGSCNKKAKKPKKSNRNIKNRYAPTLKLATNGLEVFVNSPLFLCCMDVLSNVKLMLLLMHKYCN